MKVENNNTSRLSFFETVRPSESDGGGFGALLIEAARSAPPSKTDRPSAVHAKSQDDARDPIDGREKASSGERPAPTSSQQAQVEQPVNVTVRPEESEAQAPIEEAPISGQEPEGEVVAAEEGAEPLAEPLLVSSVAVPQLIKSPIGPSVELAGESDASQTELDGGNVPQKLASAIGLRAEPIAVPTSAQAGVKVQLEPASEDGIEVRAAVEGQGREGAVRVAPVNEVDGVRRDALGDEGRGEPQQSQRQSAVPSQTEHGGGQGLGARDAGREPMQVIKAQVEETAGESEELRGALPEAKVSASSSTSAPAPLPTSEGVRAAVEVPSNGPMLQAAESTASPSSHNGASSESALMHNLESAQITDRVLRGLNGAINQRGGTLTMMLTPPELGQLRISVQFDGGVVRATFESSQQQVASLLRQQISTLRQALEGRGLTVESLSVQTPGPLGLTHTESSQSQTDQSPTDGRSRGSMDDGRQPGSERGTGDQSEASGLFHEELDLVA